MIAVYAVLLQALVSAALPVPAFESLGKVICAPGTANPDGPADEGHRHGACCILACAASTLAGLETSYVVIAFAAPRGTAIVRASTRPARARSPLKFYFAARGPPPTA